MWGQASEKAAADSQQGESMLPGAQEYRQSQREVSCTLTMGQEVERKACRAGHWDLGRGRAVWLPNKGTAVKVELAKAMLWKMRERQDAAAAEEAETRGFCMPAWLLLTQVRKGMEPQG
jgi:hypothetical protein